MPSTAKVTQSKEADAKARKAAETKIKEARAEAIRKKAEVEAAASGATTCGESEAPAAEARSRLNCCEQNFEMPMRKLALAFFFIIYGNQLLF